MNITNTPTAVTGNKTKQWENEGYLCTDN